MELPFELKMALEEQAEGIPNSQLMRDAKNLSERYRNESGKGERLVTNDTEAIAYSIVRMPATFGAVSAALKYTISLTDNKIESLLDVGAGTGAATWSADALIDLKSIICLEREEVMRRVGEKLMLSGSASMQNAKWIDYDLLSGKIPMQADLVIASYVLNEMSSVERLKAIKKLWAATVKILLIVEPGTPTGFSQLRVIRRMLLERDAHVIAPCPHETECEITQDDWCHFTCRVSRSRLHRRLKVGEVPYEDEKFAYLALTRDESRHAKARVLRHPQIGKGRVTLDLCTDEGISKMTFTKKNKELYKQARKAVCGDDIRYK